MSGENMDRAGLRALAKIHNHPVLKPKQLEKSVAEMAAVHVPEAYIRLFIAKVRVK